jgi:drug/metabolite transporter (DMT)-like permease
MTPKQVVLALSCSLGFSIGQIFFKLAARGLRSGPQPLAVLRSLADPYLIAGLALYGVVTLLWLTLLRSVPLSRVYPYAALAFVLVPFFSWLFFGERIGATYLLGVAFIVAGVVVTGL